MIFIAELKEDQRFKEKLIDLIKSTGQEIIDRAEEIAGDSDLITNLSIHVYLDQPLKDFPTIEWTTEVLNKNYINILHNKGEK